MTDIFEVIFDLLDIMLALGKTFMGFLTYKISIPGVGDYTILEIAGGSVIITLLVMRLLKLVVPFS